MIHAFQEAYQNYSFLLKLCTLVANKSFMSFQNKVVWITGASSGIGKALALELSNQNALLIISARNKESLAAVKSSCKNFPFAGALSTRSDSQFSLGMYTPLYCG